jgi:exodeoxyribonuclease VII large subunit
MAYYSDPSTLLDRQRDLYTVSRLNAEVRAVLEGSFPLLWVTGEMSNLSIPSSGHAYFSLKDAHAQVRCALFRGQRIRLRFAPANGQQVLVRARVGLYEGRGEFQLIVEHMEPAGEGALRQAIEQLKARLAAEGLFETSRKRALPAFPRQVGVITSPTGAAIRDVLSVLRRRLPTLPVVIYPAPVQGADAPAQLLRALELANARRECDVLLLVRGGGSLEDLLAFNDEALVRALAASALPVVSGIGHEIDFTLADLAADRRAPTPSAAAELVSPDRAELGPRLAGLGRTLQAALSRALEGAALRLTRATRQLERLHPASQLRQRQQRLDDLELRLRRYPGRLLLGLGAGLTTLEARLRGQSPAHRLKRGILQVQGWRQRLLTAMDRHLDRRQERLGRAGGTLDAVSPLATLARGYAIVQQHPAGTLLRDAAAAAPGQWIQARLARGSLLCRVEAVQDGRTATD